MNKRIRDVIAAALPKGAVFEVSVPPRAELGHYSTNAAMRLSKTIANRQQAIVKGSAASAKASASQRKLQASIEVAKTLAKKIERAAPKGFFSKVEAVEPGFVNFWVADGAIKKELTRMAKEGVAFAPPSLKALGGHREASANRSKTVIVEYSQPNIAKKMHVGHLRTTVLGDALANTYEALGYNVIRWNYLGDWGTQFGKLIAAYKMWGDKKKIQEDPIQNLLDLYVRFHDELKYRPELEDMGREEFKKLEEGDKENLALWKWFKEESLKEFEKIYKILGVKFDVWIGESYFEPQLKPLVEELQEAGIATVSGGALIVDLAKYDLPPALVQKSDGTSLYLTRDIANLRYRLETYHPAKILYVVGNEQTLHFAQLFCVAHMMGLAKGIELAHVKYGLVLAEEGKKFATREGRVVFLEEVIEKAVRLAYEVVQKKNPKLAQSSKKKIANTVALGALKYTNLRENRHSDIRFDWQKMLDFSGDSGPYLQYTYARLRSILRKAQFPISNFQFPKNAKYLESEQELAIVRRMIEFPDAVKTAAETYATNYLCNYLYELAVAANKFYESTPILKDENAKRRYARLLLVKTVAGVLKEGLGLLGIGALEKI